jgi:hypothetical protein
VFRQQRGSDGNWADAPPAGDVATEFENEILTRAQQISTLGATGVDLQLAHVPIDRSAGSLARRQT